MPRPVVIYQMGKVASSSLKRSLEAIGGFEVIHTHHLDAGYTARLNAQKQALGWRTTIDPERIRSLAQRLAMVPDLPVITLVREPVGRNLSAYFNNLPVIFGHRDAHASLSRDALLEGFLTRYPHNIPLQWFDEELAPRLGIDVYAQPFPGDAGCLRMAGRNCRLLLMRHDLPDDKKCRLVAELLGLERLVMQRDNVAASKPYSEVYRAFLRDARLPPEYLESMLDSRYARHFFGARERTQLLHYWSSVPRSLDRMPGYGSAPGGRHRDH